MGSNLEFPLLRQSDSGEMKEESSGYRLPTENEDCASDCRITRAIASTSPGRMGRVELLLIFICHMQLWHLGFSE